MAKCGLHRPIHPKAELGLLAIPRRQYIQKMCARLNKAGAITGAFNFISSEIDAAVATAHAANKGDGVSGPGSIYVVGSLLKADTPQDKRPDPAGARNGQDELWRRVRREHPAWRAIPKDGIMRQPTISEMFEPLGRRPLSAGCRHRPKVWFGTDCVEKLSR
jgi:hypothetical protein